MDTALLERLARLRGIGDAYTDYRGELQHFSLDTKIGILHAMGCGLRDGNELKSDLAELEAVRSRKFLPAVATARSARIAVDLNISAREFGSALLWQVQLEDGTRHEGVTSSADCAEVWRGEVAGGWITRRRFELPLEVPPGYHELQMRTSGGASERCLLIVSPPHCFEPEAIRAGRRLWGVAVQLYTLRSRGNWGIGDFNDLALLIRWLAGYGAGFVGLNPLHALAPSDPSRASPYSASSRHFLNVLYIAVPQIPEFGECAAAQALIAAAGTAARLAQLRAHPLVDYAAVAELKIEFLALLYQDFRDKHLACGSARARQFQAYAAAAGTPLQRHARFDALDRYFRATRGCASGWLNWPREYQDVDGAAAAGFAREHPAEVEFYAYLQWLAQEQLAAAQALALELGMPIGLYGDYAVGANPGGSETWTDRGSYSLTAEIGAPPDPMALRGQGWGIPPQDPQAMLARRLQGFVRLIRDNMRGVGALRLDHVMSLCRLWWVPAGSSPAAGAYVYYPLRELLSVLCLESSRNSCLVVGEDLGVVPEEMRLAMPEFGLYHYKVLLFEKVDGRFRRPEEYARRALATATTHDMPTLRSWWEGRDIELRRGLNLYPSAEIELAVAREREHDRGAALAALHDQALSPQQPASAAEPFTAELAHSMHLYLARSASALVAVQIEDLLGMTEPVNVPGTYHEYPNWQRKLTMDIEDAALRPDLAAQLAQINQARM